MNPRATLVIPTFNRESLLPEAVASAFATGLGELEVLVVDDGSTDRSLEVAQALAREEPRVRVVAHPDGRNHGPAATLNLGIRLARAPIVGFLGSDDLLLPGRFDVALPMLESDSSVDGVYEVTVTDFLPGGEARRGTVRAEVTFEAEQPGEVLATLVKQGRHWSADAILLRKGVLLRVAGFPEADELRGVEDLALWLKLAAVATLVPGRREPVAVYRLHGANLSSTSSERQLVLPALAYLDVCRWARHAGVGEQARTLLGEAAAEKQFFVSGRLRQAGRPGAALRQLSRAALVLPELWRERRFWGNLAYAALEGAGLRPPPNEPVRP